MEKPGGPSAGPSSMPLVWTVLRGTLLLLSGACMILMLVRRKGPSGSSALPSSCACVGFQHHHPDLLAGVLDVLEKPFMVNFLLLMSV